MELRVAQLGAWRRALQAWVARALRAGASERTRLLALLFLGIAAIAASRLRRALRGSGGAQPPQRGSGGASRTSRGGSSQRRWEPSAARGTNGVAAQAGSGAGGGAGDKGDAGKPPCALCGEPGRGQWRTWLLVPPREAGAAAAYCKWDCVRAALDRSDADPGKAAAAAELLGPDLLGDLRSLVDLTPQLLHRWPSVRLCLEELRLAWAAKDWPPPEVPAPPPITFSFDGLQEIRICSCPLLTKLPREIGLCKSLTSLVFLSDSLTELPEEVGDLRRLEQIFLNGNFLRTLPDKVGELPCLSDVCFDANLLESLPRFTSAKMCLFTAPGNSLRTMPVIAGQPARFELHGNRIQEVAFGNQAWWNNLCHLKLMGNDIRELPPTLGSMRTLRILGVAGNRLTALPACVAELPRLEMILAYNNEISEVPQRLLLGSKSLRTVLLEGNPLSSYSLLSLMATSQWTRAHTVALDTHQIRAWASCATAQGAAVQKSESLPMCISVGDLLDSGSHCKYYLKLTRGSQLRREPGVLASGLPGGPAAPQEQPAKLLIVAFAASQGEPEWMGALRRLFVSPAPPALPPVDGELADFLAPTGGKPDAQLAALWASFGSEGPALPAPAGGPLQLPSAEDVDLISIVDHRMRWYSEDFPALQRVLGAEVAKHERSVFVGASMGGFGALLHGGLLADAVLAFGPQSRLDQAILRPPAASRAELEERHASVSSSVRAGRRRGAQLEVHSAADEHFWHALNFPLADCALTVHPMMPRKPWAKLLDAVSLLDPIVADAIGRALERPGATRADAKPTSPEGSVDAPEAAPTDVSQEDQVVLVARWGHGGGLARHRATRSEALHMFFGPDAPAMPRPGDWFCPLCGRRNMQKAFFCRSCGTETEGAHVLARGAVKVPGAQTYPQPGDWGCGACGTANSSWDKACGRCSAARGDHPLTVVAAA